MSKGKLKKLFPGGNTAQGFHSFYNYIIAPDATRIFCIKGGPGVGKSSLMRKIGETMLDKGYDVEYHCCSSDNGSLDGVAIPALQIAMLDGTAPHVVDPKNPGVVDEILNMGVYWDEGKLTSAKEKVMAVNRRVGRLFGIAYYNLKEAKAINEELESYYTESVNFADVNRVTAEIKKEILGMVKADYSKTPFDRHMFAYAITPEGPVNYLDTILQDVKNLFLLEGEPGCGKSTVVAEVASTAKQMGIDTDLYHDSLDPTRLRLVVIPNLQVAVLNNESPINFDPQKVPGCNVKKFNFTNFASKKILSIYGSEIESAKMRYHDAFDLAVSHISQAKKAHDEMEVYYVGAMNFEEINRFGVTVLNRILTYA